MHIVMPEAPVVVTAAFLRGVSSLLAGPNTRRTEHYVGETPRPPTLADLGDSLDRSILHHALPIYSLGLKAAADKADATAILEAGWRCFAGGTKRTLVMGWVTQRGPDQWKLTSLNYGEWAWACYEATRGLERLPKVRAIVKTAEYQLRVLVVAALSREVFWLKALDPKTDPQELVIPFHGPAEDSQRSIDEIATLPHYLEWIRPQALTVLHGRGNAPRAY